MSEHSVSFSVDALRANEAWLRPLVRSLVDDATTNDVLQETWLQAWRRAPANARGLRAWLATVATNFARSHRRREHRRRQREAPDSAIAPVESTLATVERLALHRTISQAVVELPEPFRTVVLLRHYHGHEIATIAARTSTSEANVRQRLHRGHEWLRQSLLGDLGDDWRGSGAVLALLASPDQLLALPTAASTSVFFAMNKARLAVTSLLACALVGTALLIPGLLTQSSTNVVDHPEAPVVVAADHAAPAPPPTIPTNERLPVASAPATSTATIGCRGTTIDTAGRPAAMVRLGVRATATSEQIEVTTSDANGHFTLPSAWPATGLAALDPWIALATQPAALEPQPTPALLVVAPCRAQTLRVIDPLGTPLSDVTANIDNFALIDFPHALENATQPGWPEQLTAADGRCAWPSVPLVASFLAVSKPGYQPQLLVIDASTPADLLVTLVPLRAGIRLIAGVVTDARGAYVPKARVGLGARMTTADVYGHFSLRIQAGDQVDDAEALHAVTSGWYPTIAAKFGQHFNSTRDPQVLHDLRLTQPVLTIVGTVVDCLGAPCSSVLVYPWELDLLTEHASAEDLAAPTTGDPLSLCGNPVRAFARTDAEGHFALPGLSARDYRLRIYDDKVQWAFTSPLIAGGTTNARIQLPSPATGPIAGRLLTHDGKPATGVRVTAYVEVHANGGGRVGTGVNKSATTDSDGRFRVDDMPRLGAQVTFAGELWVDQTIDLAKAADPEDLQATVLRRCHVRVECTGAAWAAADIEFFDANDQHLVMQERRRTTTMSRETVALHNGKTGVLAVSEAATTLVVRTRDGKREQRIPVVLNPAEVTSIVNQVE